VKCLKDVLWRGIQDCLWCLYRHVGVEF